MFDLPEGSAKGRMPGAASAPLLSEFVAQRSAFGGLCYGCVNYVPKESLLTGRGVAGRCSDVCPGIDHILVRR